MSGRFLGTKGCHLEVEDIAVISKSPPHQGTSHSPLRRSLRDEGV